VRRTLDLADGRIGPPLAVALCAPVSVQSIVNHVPPTVAGSLKVIVTFVVTGMSAPDGPTLATLMM
jgi:hypothetical protein